MSVDTSTGVVVSTDLLDGSRLTFVPGVGVIPGCFAQGGDVRRRLADGSSEPAPGAVALPKVGEPVRVAEGVGLWLGLTEADGGSGSLTGNVLCGQRVVTRCAAASEWDARSLVVGEASEGTRPIAEAFAATLAAHAATLRGNRQWRDQLVIDLFEEASEREYCSDFDDFMERHDLPRRSLDYQVVVTVEATVRIDVSATSPREAEQEITTAKVWQALDEYAVTDWTVAEVVLD